MVAKDLVVTWEDTYRRYESAVGNDVTEASRALAGTWRELAAAVELPWWLSAAVRSAAQAFEHQADAWAGGWPGHDDMAAAIRTDAEDYEEEVDENLAYGSVVLPTQQGNQSSCACADPPPVAGRQVTVMPVARATA